MRAANVRGVALLSALILAACGDGGGPSGPNPKELTIAVQGGDQQIGTVGTPLSKPLQVVVTKAATKSPQRGVAVSWAVSGGGSVAPATSVTDTTGVASTTLTLGPTAGVVTVTANFSGNIGSAATFTAEATTGAAITSLSPTSAKAGDTITVNGTGFSSIAQNNVVLFNGIRGAVASATATQLRVVVPLCLPTSTVQVTVVLGPTTSAPAALAVTGVSITGLTLSVGQVSLLTDAAAAGCVRLPTGGDYLVTVQNASTVTGTSMDFQLTGLGGGTTASASLLARAALAVTQVPVADAQAQADWRIRGLERQLQRSAGSGGLAPRAQLAPAATVPSVGDTATFNVLNNLTSNTFTKVKAKVMLVSKHAVIYQDVNVPANGFQTGDFQNFGALFDDPIFPTDSTVFGAPSDIDANGHIVILFTPVVNALSPKGSTSFVAGFFFGCDLVTVQQCSGSNRAEIFYASVPDPTGSVGPTLSTARILQTTPPVLAHEFTHMIAWNQRVILRGGNSDALWMDEALAHTAEDTVGGVLVNRAVTRADTTLAISFLSENWRRANDYLPVTASTTLLAYVEPGSLAERGAGWLFLKYLRARFGGGILTKLVQTTQSSTDNVTAQTNTGWSVLLNDWLVALWADNAPELAGATVDPRYTFPNINLRATLGQPAFGGVYKLQPTTEPFTGFTTTGTVVSSTAAYYLVTGSSAAAPLSLSLSGPRGLPFSGQVVPQIGIMRIR